MADGIELFLKYLPSSADEEGIVALFRGCGEIVGTPRLLRDSNSGACKGVAWITFASIEGAEAAAKKDGVLYGGRHVQIMPAKQTSWGGGHAATVGGVTGTVQAGGTHTPAMASEVVKAIVGSDRDAAFVDGTFGRGGHTRAILAALSPKGSLHAFDLDPQAIAAGKKLAKEDERFTIHHSGFAAMADVLGELGIKPAGVFLDLGISSPQLDEKARGFRPEEDGPLDLRFDATSGETAAAFLRRATRAELLEVFTLYGDTSDPHAARRVADAIVLARMPGGVGCPTTTKAFASLVAKARGYEYQAMHASKTIFQALRIHVNDEFGQLRKGMAAALKLLGRGGRLGVLTWKHSECTLLVEFLRRREIASRDFSLLQWHQEAKGLGEPVAEVSEKWGFEADTAQRPTAEELRLNSRSRSAVLHVLRKKKGIRCEDLETAADSFFEWEGGSSLICADPITGKDSDPKEPPKKKRKKAAQSQ